MLETNGHKKSSLCVAQLAECVCVPHGAHGEKERECVYFENVANKDQVSTAHRHEHLFGTNLLLVVVVVGCGGFVLFERV